MGCAGEVARGQDLVSKTDLFEFGVQLRAEMDKRFARIEASLAVIEFAVYSGGAVVLALLIKRTFFP